MENNHSEYIAAHDLREKEVTKFLMDVLDECNTIFFKNDKGITPIPQRIQMIVAFSAIDVLGSYWFEYLNKTGKTNERAMAWYDEFCATTDNKDYKALIMQISSERLYRFRNALVHFFGLGKPLEDPFSGEVIEEILIALSANDLSDEQKVRMENGFAKAGHRTLMLRPRDFFDLLREGAILMLLGWTKVIAAAQQDRQVEKDHIEGIERIWKKIQAEGAKGMSREQAGLPV